MDIDVDYSDDDDDYSDDEGLLTTMKTHVMDITILCSMIIGVPIVDALLVAHVLPTCFYKWVLYRPPGRCCCSLALKT